jgi:SAM-dependent methyltransferase
VNPRPDHEELIKFYNSESTEAKVAENIARASADRIIDPEKKEYFLDNRIRPVEEMLPIGAKIFDVGCGTGAFIKIMKDHGYSAQGNDLSKVSINLGKDLLGLGDLDIFYGDIWTIPGHDYDLISLWTVIEHLLEPFEYLNYLNRKLKDDGLLLLEFPTVDSLMFRRYPEHFFWLMPPYHLYLYSINGMAAMLDRVGFKIEKEHRMPGNWNFFEVLARKFKMPEALVDDIKKNYPGFIYETDRTFDELALSHRKSSSIQLICRKK